MSACVRKYEVATKCPVTDFKLVREADYQPDQYARYEVAAAPDTFSYKLLFSRTTGHLPISGLVANENINRPCEING